MKRVRVLLRSLAHGGAEKQALLLVLALRERHDVRLVLLDGEPVSARHLRFLDEHGLEPSVLPGGTLRKFAALRRELARERVEVLFTFLPSDTALGALAARAAGVPRIFGGLRNARLAPRKERVLRLVHNHVSHLTISNSRAALEHFAARGFARERFRVIPNAILARAAAPERPPSRRVTALALGRFVPEKDFPAALEALRAARAELGDAAELGLILAGHGPEEAALRARIVELGLGAVVELVVDPPEPARLFERADLFLSTSHFEGLSNAILEAQDAGLPVVATDVGDNAGMVEEGVGGRVVALGDRDGLARALVEFARDPELRARAGQAGRARLLRDHSFAAFREAYERLLAGPG
jgi:glycosyltransferase involved in cell wall biosynthesis